MATDRVCANVPASTAVPTSETPIATLPAGGVTANDRLLVRADLTLTGAASVTGVTVNIRRGPVSGLTGAVVASTGVVTVTGSQIVAAALGTQDTGYDGTGYVLSAQAAGAAATCGPGVFEAQATVGAETFSSG